MKKIRRLSIHLRKKSHQSTETDEVETDDKSAKKQNGKSLLKRFSKGNARTSVDESSVENSETPLSNGTFTAQESVADESVSQTHNVTSEELPTFEEEEIKKSQDEEEDLFGEVDYSHTVQSKAVQPPTFQVRRLEGSHVESLNDVCPSSSHNQLTRARMPSPELCHNNILNVSNPLTEELRNLAKQGWYWGPLTKSEAESKLEGAQDGSFLVRDSSDERYLLSVSFRSSGRTLHTRIQYSHGFSFYENFDYSSPSVVKLINDSVRESQDSNAFCYMRSLDYPATVTSVKLTHPVSRLSEVRTLRYLCRFVVRQYTRIDHIENLPLPNMVKGYLNQSYF